MQQLEALGKALKQAREARGLSLEQVEAQTKIRKLHLKCIEAGEPLPSLDMVYYRLFAKTYAEYLGLDGNKLLAEYMRHPEADTVQQPVPRERHHDSASEGRLLGKWLPVLLILVITVAAMLLWGRRPSAPVSQEPKPAPTQEAQPAPPPEKPQMVTLTQSGTYSSTYEVAADRVEVLLEIVPGTPDDKECWIAATSDGNEVYQGLMQPGRTLELKGTRQITIRSGKPWMSVITINGEMIGKMGGIGPARTLVVKLKGK